MTDQTTADLIAEAREAAKRADWYMTGESPLLRALADALEAAEQERDEVRKAAEDHVLDADAVHVRLSAELREVNQERDNWKMSAEEAERAEKRAEQRAEEAERLAEVLRETIREYGRENEAWSVRAHTAERERDRLDEAFDRDLPWRYDEVETQRNQLAAVMEKVRERAENVLPMEDGVALLDMLAASPADLLREVKAAAWAGGYNAGYSDRSTPGEPFTRNPYREEQS